MNPIKASLRHSVVTLVLTALVVAVGVHAFLQMPRMEDPSITIRTGLVMAAYPGATSDQVEKQVTEKIEERLFKFAEIRKEKTYSTSRHGLAIVNVELEDNVKNADLFWAKLRHEMNELAATELPKGVRGPIVQSDFGDTVALLVAVHGPRYGYRELRDYSTRIRDEMRTVRDVGKIRTYGGQSEQILITSSLERLSQYFADPLRIIQTLQQRNIIQSGGSFDSEQAKVPLRATGRFTTEDQIKRLMVDVSRSGEPVYLGDFADVERRYQDPTFLVRYDGEPSLLIAVEMQQGKNIVQLGEKLGVVFDRLHAELPPDLKIDLVANQPGVVKERISSLSHEFMLAIGAVILVTIILLPLRVAVIAALAIPVTVCSTLGLIDAFGVQLHQVSISALIVVLGIVVDDAIVITDNFVDLLDRGVPKAEAAWLCATEVLVPVLTATLTIIGSFLPLLILSGSVGEFIQALPVTVAVALSVSFIVAVLLSPVLCRFFIRSGLHAHTEGAPAAGKFNVLDWLQMSYRKAIAFLMRHRALGIGVGVAAFLAGVALYKVVPQQFFPSAERNQFVIDLWMPEGTRIEATDAAIARIERTLAGEKLVSHYASFVGQSAPRFYYNVSPQQPDAAYGQFIVNTTDERATPGLVARLRGSLARVAPEALVIVKELQQGVQMEAPVEIRISGPDIGELKSLGQRVEGFLHEIPATEFVHNDYRNDSYFVDVDIDNETANRVGITNASVSRLLFGAFDGMPVSTYWEGDRPVDLVLRLAPERRQTFEDVGGAYVTSQLTHRSVPIRSFATLKPEWETSRIVRRNGVRTLTVRSFCRHGAYASQILSAMAPKLKELALPQGYRIDYGGEHSNRAETLPQMMSALAISLVVIFLVLLIQFRNISEPLIVMASIPLSLFGAVFGLVVTHNSFGFTAFVGLISLCGIVVRNSIILVDYINEKMREGHSLEDAARQAGERRLRPIFLTTMAAAVGVTPMILSRSSLWSPLASVIAIGLIFSMFFTLLVVPVLYVAVRSRLTRPSAPAAVAVLACLILAGGTLRAETVKLTLPEAVGRALQHNSAVKIARLGVVEKARRVSAARADLFPQLSQDANLWRIGETQTVSVPAGAWGQVDGHWVPDHPVALVQGLNTIFLNNVTLGQPITQTIRIRQGVRIAQADEHISEAEANRAENQVAYAVHELYYGLLIAHKQTEAARAQIAFAAERLKERKEAVAAGNLLDVAVMAARASLLESKHALLEAENRASDLTAEFDDLLGYAAGTEFELAELPDTNEPLPSRDEFFATGLKLNPDVRNAEQTVAKARSGIAAARADYIPDIGAFARYTYQSGVPFIANNNGTFGFQMTWKLFDFGKRAAVVGERKTQLAEAEENLRRIRNRLSVDLEKAYRRLARTADMVDVAKEALDLRRENERLTRNRVKAATVEESALREAEAATRKAETDYLQASLAARLARADLDRIAGQAAR
jgi:multidrug efflux pump subunit AcrB/outer membrane protein TolC